MRLRESEQPDWVRVFAVARCRGWGTPRSRRLIGWMSLQRLRSIGSGRSACCSWRRRISFLSYEVPCLPGVDLLIELRHVDSEAAMARELDRDVARRTGHENERRIRSLTPPLGTNNNVVITVADWDGKPIQDPHWREVVPRLTCRTPGRRA